ncbi:hypothetical protein HY629_02040 [Candidatus Uhrbacteria bacterium]|nr:hypothetical protein [Candidatus Uhrbacteria bacterium]
MRIDFEQYCVRSAISLTYKTSVTLYPKPPYHFDATLHKPSHFPSSDNVWEKGKYWITMLWNAQLLGLRLEDKGTMSVPRIRVTVFSKNALSRECYDTLTQEFRYRFNIETDIAPFIQKYQHDRVLGPYIKRWKGMKPVAANGLYETLVIYIVLQNATVRRTHQMLEALFERFGKEVQFDGKTLSTFWDPKAIARVHENVLRKLKLGYRAKFLKRISEQFAKGYIDEYRLRTLPREHAKQEALKLYGIGPASVEYLLFEDLYHCGTLETIPPWEQKILSQLIFHKRLVPVSRILKFFKTRYAGWEKLASHYLWEDIFWQRKTKKIPWLEKEIRL